MWLGRVSEGLDHVPLQWAMGSAPRIRYDSARGTMRPILIAGLLLLGLGAVALVLGASFTGREVYNVGDVTVVANDRQPLRPWVGGVVLLAGAALLVAGVRQRA